MKLVKRNIYKLLKLFDIGSAIAVRLTKITGKSSLPVHPKHLINEEPFYLSYIEKKDYILDLGCNNGQNTIKVAKKCKKVVGIDIDETILKIARENTLPFKNVKLVKGSLEERLPFKDAQFSKILMLAVLEHIKNRLQLINEVKRVVKVGGIIFISVPNKETSWKYEQRKVGLNYFSDPDHKIEYSEEDIRKLMLDNGLKIIDFRYTRSDTYLRGLIDIIGGISLSLYKRLLDYRKNIVINNPKEAISFELIVKKTK